MTNKEELQKHIQLLNEIKSRYPILNDTIKYLEEYKQSLSNHTLLECIKEWEDRGFKFIFNETFKNYISITNSHSINNESDELEFNINTKDKTLSMFGECVSFPYDLINLLSKTIKALEAMKDE